MKKKSVVSIFIEKYWRIYTSKKKSKLTAKTEKEKTKLLIEVIWLSTLKIYH